MKILIVHAHHEPHSFCSALAREAEKKFLTDGHSVDFADLYAENFDPVSDRRNFTTTKNPDFLKQQIEEAYASECGGFAPDLEQEIQRLEACDLLIFSFPLWWFGMPAILKGWVDRVFAAGRIYGGEKLYENGLGKSLKRGLVLMTTGGGPVTYSGRGFNPPMDTVLVPIQHGVFWFNGFLPLLPFIAWSPIRISPEEREKYLVTLSERLANIFTEPPQILPPLRDFPDFGADSKKRFMVTISRIRPIDEDFIALIPAETARVEEFKRLGIALTFQKTPPAAEPWHGYMLCRGTDAADLQTQLATLPLAPWLDFVIEEIA